MLMFVPVASLLLFAAEPAVKAPVQAAVPVSAVDEAGAEAPPKILVMRWSIASGAEVQGSQLFDDLLTSMVADAQPDSEVVGMADVEALLDIEQAKDLIGCADVTCTAEIGLALDAELLVQGSLGKIGDRLFVVLKVIEARDATVAARVDGSTTREDATPLMEKLVYEVFGVESATVYTLPGASYEQWLSRMQDLAYAPLRCGETEACLRIALGRIEDIEFLLSKDDWPPELEEHREALVARLASLRSHAARLRELLHGTQTQTSPTLSASTPVRNPVVIVIQEPVRPTSSAERAPMNQPSPVVQPVAPPRRYRTPVRLPSARPRPASSQGAYTPVPAPAPAPKARATRASATPKRNYQTVKRSSSARRKAAQAIQKVTTPRAKTRSRVPFVRSSMQSTSSPSRAVRTTKAAASKVTQKRAPTKKTPARPVRRTTTSRTKTVPR